MITVYENVSLLYNIEALEGFLGMQGYWQKIKGIHDKFVNKRETGCYDQF